MVMRQATWAVLAALLLLGGCQAGAGVSGGGGGRWPGGDWAESCRDATLRGGTLLARCRERDGDWRSTSIRTSECPGNRLRNDNGRLVCAGGGWDDDDAWTSGGPRGSWAQSCRQAQVSGSRLTATCRDRDGRYQRSSIIFTQCRGNRVANLDGRLRCDG